MDNDFARWHLPDTEICSAAWQLAFEVSPAFLVNHCVRSYLFGRELATAQGVAYDDELVFLSCLLHDLGLTGYGDGDQRFEVDGADAAVRFLRENGLPEERSAPVWQSIALHTSVGLAHRFGPVQAVSFHRHPVRHRHRWPAGDLAPDNQPSHAPASDLRCRTRRRPLCRSLPRRAAAPVGGTRRAPPVTGIFDGHARPPRVSPWLPTQIACISASCSRAVISRPPTRLRSRCAISPT